jgi:hypothetical protein
MWPSSLICFAELDRSAQGLQLHKAMRERDESAGAQRERENDTAWQQTVRTLVREDAQKELHGASEQTWAIDHDTEDANDAPDTREGPAYRARYGAIRAGPKLTAPIGPDPVR